MPLKSDYNHIICIMEGETKNIRFVLKIYRFVLRLLNISFCGLYNYDEEMADIHLCLIGQLHTKDVAKDYWHEVKNDNINLDDWCVLWGEMVKRNDGKIKKWFPKINALDYERKIFDECISFLDNGGLPYHDLKV